MENAYPPKKRKKFYQADFLTRPVLLLAALLFLVFQIVRLIRMFSEAVSYKKVNQVTPEDFTLPALTGVLVMIGLAAWLLIILDRQRRGRCVIRRGNRFLLLDLLLIIYGLVRTVKQLLLFFQNFEILFLLDVLSIIGGMIAPPVILFLADRQRIPPGDVLLLIIGAGTMGFSILSFIMVAISIGKDYTVMHALPELGFRLAVLLTGFATFRTALKLRAELPLDLPLAKQPDKPKPKKAPRGPHISLFDNLPGYDDEEPEESLFEEDEPEPEEESYAPEPPPANGRAECTYCGKRFPAYLGQCPRCGRGLEDAEEEPPDDMPEPAPRPAPVAPPPHRYADDDSRATCPDCGKRFPKFLGVCPRCGRDM